MYPFITIHFKRLTCINFSESILSGFDYYYDGFRQKKNDF